MGKKKKSKKKEEEEMERNVGQEIRGPRRRQEITISEMKREEEREKKKIFLTLQTFGLHDILITGQVFLAIRIEVKINGREKGRLGAHGALHQ